VGEVDFERRLWVSPGVKMKSGKSHTVPLSDAAIELLDRQATVATGDAIFPRTRRVAAELRHLRLSAGPRRD
jgi:integrase